MAVFDSEGSGLAISRVVMAAIRSEADLREDALDPDSLPRSASASRKASSVAPDDQGSPPVAPAGTGWRGSVGTVPPSMSVDTTGGSLATGWGAADLDDANGAPRASLDSIPNANANPMVAIHMAGTTDVPRGWGAFPRDAMGSMPAGESRGAGPRRPIGPGDGVAVGAIPAAEGVGRVPDPRAADLLAAFSPFDRATIERSIDQVLDRLDDLEAGLSQMGATGNLIPGLLAVAAVGIAQAVLWQIGNAREDSLASADGDGDEDACSPGRPSLPRHRILEE